MDKRFDRIKALSLEIVRSAQMKDGSFESLSFAGSDLANPLRYKTTFAVSNIILALRGSGAQDLIQRSIRYLMKQKSPNWSWNYWDRFSREFKNRPYPDDMDDTFLSLAAIKTFAPESLTGQAFSEIVSNLTSVEDRAGGPYRTWLVGAGHSPVWRDVDLVVNSNIYYFLLMNNIKIPSIEALQDDAILRSDYYSKYYPSIYQVIYFLARSYRGKNRSRLIKYLIDKKGRASSWGNLLEDALAITSLIELGVRPSELKREVSSLLKKAEDLGFEPYPFCIDPLLNGLVYFSGSRALTAAFVYEALRKIEHLNAVASDNAREDEELYEDVVKHVLGRFANLGSETRSRFNSLLGRMIEFDKNTTREMVLMPYFFHLSLKSEFARKISRRTVRDLCIANLYGWISYKIYDDIIDEEGQPEMLGIANICLRELSVIYTRALGRDLGLFVDQMDKLDASMLWERLNAFIKIDLVGSRKIPVWSAGVIADKSVGHILGPLAMTVLAGLGTKSREFRVIESMLRDYLVAKQINDDAHDWTGDLQKGFVNSVGSVVLAEAKRKGVPADLESLKPIFWNITIKKIARLIVRRIDACYRKAGQIDLFKDVSPLKPLFERVRSSGKRAIDDWNKSEDFLKSYKRINHDNN